jgi:8-hydroxy-5-deazaflavin:NADPH oxidoreductase
MRRRALLQAIVVAVPLLTLSRAGAEPNPSKMKIGVVGAGSLGGTVARLWIAAGHEVMFSSRHPEELAPMAKRLGARASVGTAAEAAAFGDIVLFAVPYDALPALGKDLASALRGKIVLDACNPAPGSTTKLTRDAETSGVAETSAKLLPGTRYVRVFSAVNATSIAASAKRKIDKLGVPLASDDAKAREVASQLVRDVGSEPVAVGGLAAARGFQRGGAGFVADTTAPKLRRLLKLPITEAAAP